MAAELTRFDGRHLGLYFSLRDGESADLEVIARASLAWVDALRAAVHAVDPAGDFRVKVIDADEGSLILNAVIAWLDERIDEGADWFEALPRPRRLMIVFAVFMIFTAGPAYDTYFGDESATPEQVEAAVNKIRADPEFKNKRKKFYRELEQDPAITGVGIKPDEHSPPIVYVESQHFAEAGGLWSDVQEDAQERMTSTIVDVVLVKPALVGEARSWEFEAPGIGRFHAIMQDGGVLRAMREAGLPERLREGIPMRVRLEVREIAINGAWKVASRGRVITHVITPQID